MSIYLDYQSAKPVDPRVIQSMQPYFYKRFGNPSSLHTTGDGASEALENARVIIADFIGAQTQEIIFTSGATEANNLAIIGYAMRNRSKGNHIIISEIEHINIHNIAKFLEKNGFVVSKVPVNQYGEVNAQKINDRITKNTILVSIAWANNEIGTIQKMNDIGVLCRENKIALHSDAVAAEGLLQLNVAKDLIDMLTLSSNDIYGPSGVGVLYLKKGTRINPIIIGGGQEYGLRSGTENVSGIMGMAKAAEILKTEMTPEIERLLKFRNKLIREILGNIPKSYLNGHPSRRLPNNAHFRFSGVEGESLLLLLKDKGIDVSTGSACSSKTLEPSHTLIATGLLHEEAHGSLQITCGRFSTEKDIDKFLNILPGVVKKLRRLSPLYKEE
jgi:cysteine desulfurase